MEVIQSGLMSFLSNPDVEFSIPSYQRLYSWSEDQCEELWLDIMRAEKNGRNHFMGTVICDCKPSGGGIEQLEIIDGQQRLTSVSLVVLALANYFDTHRCHADNLLKAQMLRSDYLISKRNPSSQPPDPKLTLSRHDIDDYADVLEGKRGDGDSSSLSPIFVNLAFFENKMLQDDFDPLVLLSALDRLFIIIVKIDDASESQSIFESINSKGVSLNAADMIRNYLLLAEDRTEQTRLYETYWRPSQEMFAPDPGSLKLNSGIKSWLSIRLRSAKVMSANKVYASFKKYAEDIYAGEKEPILRELRGFCLMWAENYRYHGVKKFKSGSNWAELGAPTLTSGYKLKKADNEEYARRVREKLKNTDSRW